MREKQWLPGHLIGHECQPRPPDHTAYRHWHGMAAPPRHRVPCPLHDPDAPSTSSMIALPRHRVPCPLHGTGATPTPAQTPTIHCMTWLHLSTTRHRRHSDPGIGANHPSYDPATLCIARPERGTQPSSGTGLQSTEGKITSASRFTTS